MDPATSPPRAERPEEDTEDSAASTAPEVSGGMLARNSMWVLISDYPGALLKLLVLTPIILGALGLEGYGVWGLLFGICAYIEQFNMSFGFAYAKFAAEYDLKRDYETLANIVSSGIVIVCSGALTMIGIIALFRDQIFSALNIPDALAYDATISLYIIIVSVMVRMSVGCYYRMLAGLQRMDLEAKLHVGADLLFFTLSVVLLYTVGGITSLAIAWLAQELARTIVAWRVWCAMRPALRLSPFNCTRYGFRRILALGGKFQLLSLIGLWIIEGFRFLLSALFGPAMVGIYDLAFKIINFGRRAPMAVIGPLMPAFTNLHQRGEHERSRSLYIRISRVLALITFIIYGFVCMVPDLMIFGWTKSVYDPAPFILVVLSFSAVVHLLTGVGTAALRGQESIRYEFEYVLVQFFTVVLLAYPAYRAWGVHGVVVAYSVGFGLGAAWFLFRYSRHENVSLLAYTNQVVVQPLLRVLPACALLYALQWPIPWLFTTDGGRWLVLGKVAILGVVFVATAVLCVRYGRLLNDEEAASIRKVWGKIRGSRTAAVSD